jgi:hypothetical protein
MGLRGKRRRAGSWRRLVGMAARADLPPERRAIRCGPGEEPDPDRVAALVAQGFRLVHVAKVGWYGSTAGFDYHYERPATRTPPRPIRRRK